MDQFMLQDEGVIDRIRQAEEFLDPSMLTTPRGAQRRKSATSDANHHS